MSPPLNKKFDFHIGVHNDFSMYFLMEIPSKISRICPSRPKISKILHGVHVQAQNYQIQHRKHRRGLRPRLQGRFAPLYMLSVLNLMIMRLDVDSVEDFADFGSAGANPAHFTENFHKKMHWKIVMDPNMKIELFIQGGCSEIARPWD